MKKRLLAMLLVLMLVVSLLPVGALAANSMSVNKYFTLDYDNGGVLDRTITVNLLDPDGKQIDTLTVNNAKGAQYNYTIALTSSISSQYDIEGMSITGGNPGSSSISNDSLSFWLGLTTEYDGCTVNVYLCPEYKNPDFPNGEIDTGATIEYIAYEPALLKLLYVNDVTGVDENTEINGVEFNFVQNYTGDDFEFLRVGTGANNLMYYTAMLSDVADRGNPRNIRSIDISYTLGDGTEETLRVYSGDLRYIKIDADTYEIEANNDDTSIVAFYNQPGAQYSTWSLYDVKFVNTGDALGDENMPETPTYPATEYDFTNWDKNVGGGSPFLPNEEIDDDTVVYAMKTSSSIGGTEFHVMNTNNVLLDRIVEKYNAENNTEYGISDIVLNSVRIQVNGADDESTNPNYFSNRWESPDNPYYHVNNGGIVGSHEIYSNTHIPHGEVRSITVFATTTDGKNIGVNIPRSNNCGDVSISLVQDNIVEIIINAPPEKPTDDDLVVDPDVPGDTGLLASAVTVTCTTDGSNHSARTFDLLPGSFSIGDVVYTTEGYTCTVTVNADAYVTTYSNSTENGTHELAEGESSTKTIKLVYSDNSWTVPEGENSQVKFTVKCEPIVYTINVEFGKNDPTWNPIGEKGSVTSADPEAALTAPVEAAIAAAPEGMEFVGWKYMDMLDADFVFNFESLSELIGDNFSDEHEAWVNITAVYEPIVYTINVDFGKNDPTWSSFGKGSVTSDKPEALTAPTAEAIAAAPEGMEFVGWKYMDMLDAGFVFNFESLSELIGNNFSDEHEAWVNITADYKETPVEPEPTPDPAITGFSKTLVKDRNLYVYQGLAYPTFYRGSVIVDEGDGVTLLYKITVKGTPGTEFTLRDDSADFAQTGVIPSSGETSFYVAKTFSWRDVRNAGDTLDNTASVSVDGETVKTDTERVPVDIDWDINVPDIDDDDDDDDTIYVPNWLNTTDHYAYIVGYEDGTIRPQNNITRAEVSTIFFRLLTDNARARYWSQTNDYTDVAADSWYNNAVSTLSNMGIINGYEDGTFKPNASITRAEFTAIATRFFDYEAEYDGAFNDVSARAWYADYVQAAVDMGLVDGYPDGGFHPNSNITRAEAVTIVNRVLNRAPHEDHLLDEDEMNVWPDNVYGAWYYADMQEATNSHDYDWIRVSGERVEEWTEKLPERDWAALEQEWSSSHDA